MGTMLILIIILAFIIMLITTLLVVLLVKNSQSKKRLEQHAVRAREQELNDVLKNPYMNNEGSTLERMKYNPYLQNTNNASDIPQYNEPVGSTLSLSYCMGGRVFEKSVRINEHINIGRTEYNNIIIDDLTVSSKHCEIYSVSQNFYIRDLYSKNQTRILRSGHTVAVDAANGMMLITGDKILVGNIEIWVTIS